MKLSLLIVSLLAFSCGKVPPGISSGTSVGQSRSTALSQTITDADRVSIAAICSALTQKQTILPAVVGSTHSFTTLQSDCGQTNQNMLNVDVTIASVNNGFGSQDFVFKRKSDGVDFLFPFVETTQSGAMADICQSGTLVNPTVNPQTASRTYFTTAVSPSDCPTVAGETCIMLELGTLSNNEITIQTQEWVRFRTDLTASKTGFFTYRKRISKAFCAQNQFITSQAVLK